MWWSTPLFLIDFFPALYFRYVFRRTQHGDLSSLLWGTVADLAAVIFFVVVTASLQARMRRRAVVFVSTLLWWGYCAVVTTYLQAMHVLPSPQQARFLLDPHFVAASLSPSVAFGVLSGASGLLWGLSRVNLRLRPLKGRSVAAIGLLCALSFLYPDWRRDGNPLVVQAYALFVDEGAPPGNMLRLEHDLSGEPVASLSGEARPNVLLVVLEGIPGGYIRSNVDFVNGSADCVMPKLSRWAERGFRVPNFLTHRNQTINGLYSMLCADYPRLFDGTPVVQDLLAHPVSRDYMPDILARNGYNTAYLQAAELRFMDKDRFMRLVGFEEVLGEEWFDSTPPAFFSRWGINDRDFFLQSLKKIRELNEKRRLSNRAAPWFLTLLTVGTHHPYELPEDYAEGEDLSPKLRSVRFLDEAADLFLTRLEAEGVLEDTLVIVTSDESHGMNADVLLAGNWGLCFALTPRKLAGTNPGLFGLVDLPLSILDGVGLAASADGIPGRSIFRRYGTSGKRILAGSWGSRFFVVSDDVVLLKDFGRDDFSHYALTGSPFALSNNAEALEGGTEGNILREAALLTEHGPGEGALTTWRFLPDGSTFRAAESGTFEPLPADSKIWLSGGQYIRLRKGDRYVLELDVLAPETNARPVFLDWSIFRLNDASPTGTSFFVSDESFRLPFLEPGERLKLLCFLEVREDFTLDSARLAARVEPNAGRADIEVGTFALRQVGSGDRLPDGAILYEGEESLVLLDAFSLTTAQGLRRPWPCRPQAPGDRSAIRSPSVEPAKRECGSKPERAFATASLA